MALIAQIEGLGDFDDGSVLVSGEATLTHMRGACHNGGADQAAADLLLKGYWLIVILDRDGDLVFTEKDRPFEWQWRYFTVGGAVHAIGWDGTPGNLLQGGITFTLARGKLYLAAIVAIAADGTYSAAVSWPAASEPVIEKLLNMTADGLAGANVSDYEALRFRCNRCDPPLGVA